MWGCKRFHDVHPILRSNENLTLLVLKSIRPCVSCLESPSDVRHSDATWYSPLKLSLHNARLFFTEAHHNNRSRMSCTLIELHVIKRIMTWKGFGRKRSWSNRGINPEFVWVDRGKPWKPSKATIPVQIRTLNLPNTCQKLYRYTIPIGHIYFLIDLWWIKQDFPNTKVVSYLHELIVCLLST
jgi:hypothetical protein